MKLKSMSTVAFLIGVVCWGVMTWPLPKHLHDGIGAASVRHNWRDESRPRMMIPGDHLQLLYRFWLLQDMLAGQTPPLKNVYEFNYRGDADRRQPGFFYVPFSLVYAAIAPWGGAALAWNLVGILSMALTALFAFRWARRYTGHEPAPALLAALCTAAFPYRIHNLLGGSPAGFAMMWVPMLLDGLDRTLYDKRISGGVQAGVALLFAAFTDMQVFFFCALMAAAWTPLSYFLAEGGAGLAWPALRRRVSSLLPALVLGGVAVLAMLSVKQAIAGSHHMAGGRSMDEVAKFSAHGADLFSFWRVTARGDLVYLGVVALLMLLGGLVWMWLHRDARRVGLLCLLIVLASMGWFTLGPNAPDHGLLFKIARKGVPPLKMMRQPAKVLCLFAPLLGLGVAMAFSAFSDGRKRRVLLGLVGALILFDYGRQTWPAISLIADESEAYHQVAEQAAADDGEAHAVAIPLWPGDSHWSGVYTHYASLYRIRMVNGYSPVVASEYYDHVFLPLRSLNAGVASDEQLDLLLAMQVDHLLLHEDAFPEKVSPFPVASTLDAFLRHPRLALLADAEDRIYAFRILPQPDVTAVDCVPIFSDMMLCPTRFFELGRPRSQGYRKDPAASGGGYITAGPGEAHQGIRGRRAGIVQRDRAAFWLRARGNGSLVVRHRHDDGHVVWQSEAQTLQGEEWQWLSLPVTGIEGYQVGRPAVAVTTGTIDLDCLLYTRGTATAWMQAGEWALPAAWFFHAGRGKRDGSVEFEPLLDPAGGVLYGPRLPLAVGRYEAELIFETDAPQGRRVASFGVDGAEAVAVRKGERCILPLDRPETTPATFTLYYRAKEPLTVQRIIIKAVAREKSP